MKRLPRACCVASIGGITAALIGLAVPVDAIQQDNPNTWLVILKGSGPPNGRAEAGVQLSESGLQIGELSIEIRYPSKLLKFENAVLAAEAADSQAKVSGTVKMDGDAAVLEVIIAAPRTGDVRRAFPQGSLADLQFRVADGVEPRTLIPLKVTKAVAVPTQGDASQVRLDTRDGQILVSDPTVITCFFYMH